MFSTLPAPAISNTTADDTVISVQAFGDVLKMYAAILTLCSIVALLNYHRLRFPLPISLSLSGLVMSILLVSIDAALSTHPIRIYVENLLKASDFDEVILKFGVGFIMFASAMESDINSLKPRWGLVFLLSACGVVISIIMCAVASLAIFLGFGYYSTPVVLNEILVCVLFGAVVAPTDAHHFVLEALRKSGAPESFSAIIVGEGLTNDALAVVAFSVVKTIVDSQYVGKNGGCNAISSESLCMDFHVCEWVSETHHNSVQNPNNASQIVTTRAGTAVQTINQSYSSSSSGKCIAGEGEVDVWSEVAKDIFGGVFIGIFLGWIFSSIMRRIRQPNINILLSITLVLDVIVLSNLLHSSPAVACAAAGLFLRAFGLKYIERRSQEELDIVWKFFEEALSGIFFLLIGLCIITDEFSVAVFFASVIAIPVTLGARYCSVALPMWAWNYVSVVEDKIPWSIVPAMTWGGIRGGSSVALALSLSPVEGRSTIFAMTYAVVLHSLIVQGLSLPKFLKNLFPENGVGGNSDQLSWLAAEKDGILDDLRHGMDTSPLLRQMLAEQGIAREHLERVSDTQSIVSGSDSHSVSSRHGSRSLPRSLTTSPQGSYGRSPPSMKGLSNLHIPGQHQQQYRPPLSPNTRDQSRHHSAPVHGNNSGDQHSHGYFEPHSNRNGSRNGSNAGSIGSLDGNESRGVTRQHYSTGSTGSTGSNGGRNNSGGRSVYDHQWSSQASQSSQHSNYSNISHGQSHNQSESQQIPRALFNTMDGATNTLLPRNGNEYNSNNHQLPSSFPSQSQHHLANYNNSSNHWDTLRNHVLQGSSHQMHRPSSMDSGSISGESGSGSNSSLTEVAVPNDTTQGGSVPARANSNSESNRRGKNNHNNNYNNNNNRNNSGGKVRKNRRKNRSKRKNSSNSSESGGGK